MKKKLELLLMDVSARERALILIVNPGSRSDVGGSSDVRRGDLRSIRSARVARDTSGSFTHPAVSATQQLLFN
jgi:hypothetical protein